VLSRDASTVACHQSRTDAPSQRVRLSSCLLSAPTRIVLAAEQREQRNAGSANAWLPVLPGCLKQHGWLPCFPARAVTCLIG
jgi:hypothetical protein